jgi:signal peptidase I
VDDFRRNIHQQGNEAERPDRRRNAAQALKSKDHALLQKTLPELEALIEKDLARFRPNAFWETAKALLIAVVIALGIRRMFIEPFRIPSGSMIPTLLIGDQLMVNKLSFGPDLFLPYLNPAPEKLENGAARLKFRVAGKDLVVVVKKLWWRRDPRRGEIIVFRWPSDPSQDYIKRVVGLPGDTVAVRQGDLYINGVKQPVTMIGPYDGPLNRMGCPQPTLFTEELISGSERCAHPIIHCQPESPFSSFGPVTVPPGHVFGMGDNRDMSSDSRVWGPIPLDHIKGDALFIHLPLDPDKYYLPRWGRFFKRIR